MTTTCRNCQRQIVELGGRWIDPNATGDDEIWSETCDENDEFTAEHEPTPDKDDLDAWASDRA